MKTNPTKSSGPGHPRARCDLRGSVCLLAVLLAGCAHYPVNAPRGQGGPDAGYRFPNVPPGDNSRSLLVILAFSGGGTRAAALSYGVLQELARTPIVWEGRRKRLLDEVDWISSVSGGSFTAAYYALYGDRIFCDYESAFLKRNVGAGLARQAAAPWNWWRLASPWYGRSDLAAEYYDQLLFHHATYGDLRRRPGRPFLMVNATDITLTARFEFTQGQFDLIGSDLDSFPIARAVAASAAFPALLTPITLRNYAGHNGEAPPEWVTAARPAGMSARQRNRLREVESYLDAAQHPYLHLVDGGLTDNLGLRGPLEAVLERDSVWSTMEAFHLESLRKVVLIVVNAATTPGEYEVTAERNPGALRALFDAERAPIHRYAFETVELFREQFDRWTLEIRERRLAAARSAGASTVDPPPPDVQFYLTEVSFDALPDAGERGYFNRLRASLHLPPEAVDRLCEAGGRLLRQSDSFRKLVADLSDGEARVGPSIMPPERSQVPGVGLRQPSLDFVMP
jgi:NTE family protein